MNDEEGEWEIDENQSEEGEMEMDEVIEPKDTYDLSTPYTV
jgi:hypothetical protein